MVRCHHPSHPARHSEQHVSIRSQVDTSKTRSYRFLVNCNYDGVLVQEILRKFEYFPVLCRVQRALEYFSKQPSKEVIMARDSKVPTKVREVAFFFQHWEDMRDYLKRILHYPDNFLPCSLPHARPCISEMVILRHVLPYPSLALFPS